MSIWASENRLYGRATRAAWDTSTFAFTALLAGAAAFAVVVPFFFLGNASGHDFEFHLASWMDVAIQWRQGVLYPRWAALANWGYGEPRFIFYPPVSWMLGAALSFVLPWAMVPGAFIWLALTFAGLSMFTLAKEWFSPRDAMAAGVLFAINPYHLVTVYWRSDFAELLASALIPLALLFAIRTVTDDRRAWALLALVTAGVWLSNAPAAVVVAYTAGLIVVTGSAFVRSARPLLRGGAALGLGLALAAFYILPAALEQPWVNISEVLAPGLGFPENFLFTRTPDAEHTHFNFIVSWIAVEVIAVTFAGMLACRRRWIGKRPAAWIWWVLVVVSTLLMLPVTSFLWAHLPELRFVQFPWRLLLVLDVPFALSLAVVLGSLRGAGRLAGWTLVLAALAVTGFLLTRSNWWDSGGAADFYEEHFRNSAGYFGVDEYGPYGSDHYDLNQNAPLVELSPATNAGTLLNARAQVRNWGPRFKEFTISSPEPVTAAARLLNYPAWRVEANGRPARAVSESHTGQLLIPLPAGESHVRIEFAETADRRWGWVISAGGVVLLLAVLAYLRTKAA